MPIFKYKAKTKEGKVYERQVEAQDRLDIYKIIRDEGATLVSIEPVSRLGKVFSFGNILGGIKTQQKIIFAKNLSAMLDAGLPMTRALAVMGKQSKSKPLKKLITEIEENIGKGETLSESLKKHPKDFSTLFTSLVRAGEESGTVSSSLKIVASQLEKTYLLTKKVRGALIYPAVIVSVMIVIAILMLIFMVPTLTQTFEGIGVDLPLSTRALIVMSSFLVENTLIFFSALLIVLVSILAFFRSSFGRKLWDIISIRVPVIGFMIKEVQSARTARTLSSLLGAGVEIVMAIDVTIDVMQNHLYKDTLKKARAAIEKGEPMSAVFLENENLYPVFIGEMISVGEETGKISDMLLGVAQYYEDEVDQKTKDLSTIIEPILMVVIGIGVGIFAISMLAPTYSLVDYI